MIKKNMGGRPPKHIDDIEFKKLCSLHCTCEEIASFFDVSADTIDNWCKRTFKAGYSECFKKYSGTGKISLRRAQFKKALEGNVPMLIWLGKQYLNQIDRVFNTDREPEKYDEPESFINDKTP